MDEARKAELIAMFSKPKQAATSFSGDWDTYITQEAANHPNVPESVVRALIQRESSGNPIATAETGKYGKARGLGQFIDSTAKTYIPNWKDPSDSYIPHKNIKGIYNYLDDLVKQTGSIDKALVRYHGGGVDILGTDSNDYANQILANSSKATKFTPKQKSKEELIAAFQKKPIEKQVATAIKDTGYLQGLGEYYTKDIPETAKGVAERTINRFNRINEPTRAAEFIKEKTGATGLVAKGIDAVAGQPERLLRGLGGITGTVGEGAGALLELGGKATNRLSGGLIGEALKPVGEAITKSEVVKDIAKKWEALSDADKANIGATADLFEALGWGATTKAAKTVGKTMQKGGINALGGELKIKETLAKRGYGKSIFDKKQRMLNNIAKYDLEAPFGNFQKVAEKADNLASNRYKAADKIIKNAAKTAPKDTYIDNILTDAYDYVDDSFALGTKDKGRAIIDRILADAEAVGLTGKKDLNAVVEFKKSLNPQDQLFKSGPSFSDEAQMEKAIRKYLYSRSVNTIEPFAPKAARLNREAKELWDIKTVVDDAASRIANRKFASLTDRMIAVGGGMSALGGFASGNTNYGLSSILATLGSMAALKAAGQGRLAGTMIKGGKALTRTAPEIGIAGAGAQSILSRPINSLEEK